MMRFIGIFRRDCNRKERVKGRATAFLPVIIAYKVPGAFVSGIWVAPRVLSSSLVIIGTFFI